MEKEIRWNTALYIRLSREDGDKEESDSVANQRRLLTEYIKGQKELVFYDIYVDDGFSGTNFNRPGFKKMMRDAEEGRVNCVIVKDLSRFGRDYIDTGRYLERIFPEYGIRFISLSDGIDSKKQSYDLLLPIKNVFNEQYARDISRKVHTAVRTKQRAGEFIGAFSSYGYRKAPGDKNKLLIDEYAAKVVRSIFEMYIKGYGKQRIAKELNQKGIPCPSEYKRLNGEHYKNCNRLEQTSYWTYSTINSILHKELYTGKMVQGTRRQHMRGRQKKVEKENWIVVENTHEPIIDKDTWDKAQSLLERRTRTVSMENDQNIFAGFVKCGDCGRAMTKNTWTGKDGKRRRTLYCGTYKRNGMHFCTPHAVPLALLEDIVLEDFNQLLKTMPSLEMLVRESIPEKRGRGGCGEESARIREELLRLREKKRALYEDYQDGLITREEFVSYQEDYRKKEKNYEKRLEAASQRQESFAGVGLQENAWLKTVTETGRAEFLNREMVVELIHQITIYEGNRIKIQYNFSPDPEMPAFAGRYGAGGEHI